ncbi:MAG: DUF456 domain-containing protein [Bacteroidota bacterium]|nr:DUF456 domain-containing protein [Bacteroidota bacterium]
MELLLIGLGCLFIFSGLIGSFIPVIPGPPFSFFGLLCLKFHSEIKEEITSEWLIVYGIIMLLISILDYALPIWGTKRFGGTKAGQRGSTFGLLLVVFLGVGIPILGILGVILAPFLGAVLGELIAGQSSNTALKSGFGSFLGFLSGTVLKLTYGFVMAFEFLKHCLRYWL